MAAPWDMGSHLRAIPTPNMPLPHGLPEHASIGSAATLRQTHQHGRVANHVYHADGRLAPTPPSAMMQSASPQLPASVHLPAGDSKHLLSFHSSASSVGGVERSQPGSGAGAGPSIFIPGTTITKEDIEILHMRYEGEIEQARAETDECRQEVDRQASLVKQLTEELERSKAREADLLETTMNKDIKSTEAERQLEAITALLDASEKELVEKTQEVEIAKEQSSKLASDLSAAQADLQAESHECDELRRRFQTLDSEVEKAKKVLGEQKKQMDELVRANGLYKVTHEKYVREGKLSEQLAGAVDGMRKDSANMEMRLQRLHDTRTGEAKAILKHQKDIIGAAVPLMLAVKELSKMRDSAGENTIITAGTATSQQWDTCINKLQQATASDIAEQDTASQAHLKKLSGLLANSRDHPSLDVAALKKEVDAMQQESGGKGSSEQNVETIRDVCSKIQDCVALCAQEVQTACAFYRQYARRMDQLNGEVAQARGTSEPLLEQLQRVSDDLAVQKKEAGQTRAFLDTERRKVQEQQGLLEQQAQQEAALRKRLQASAAEIQRMQGFMAKLQITDVPQLHAILSDNGTPRNPASATPLRPPPSNPPSAASVSSSKRPGN